MKTVTVFLVDDSALVRQLTADLLSREPDIEIIGTAPDPVAALQKLRTCKPDVILLDIEMPRMDGLTFLEVLKNDSQTSDIAVLMFSSLTELGCEVTLRALERGAVDFITKPKLDLRRGFQELINDLIYKVRAAALAKKPNDTSVQPSTQPISRPPEVPSTARPSTSLIAIGSSTGGTEALREILKNLPDNLPPIVLVQHMHERFTGPFAQRLNQIASFKVSEACNGDKLESGQAYLAPGSQHMEVHKVGGHLRVRLTQTPAVNGHRPSVDVLFHSCAKAAGPNAVAAILTGMGSDGAKGLLAMRNAGAYTIAQNEASCVVFGMPKEAINVGAAVSVLPISAIAAQIQALSIKY